MTDARDSDFQASTAGPASALRINLQDLTAIALLSGMVFILLIYKSDAFPMQYWDECRNAINALEAALDGHWLAPTYLGRVDHWNTKPPLLIWMIAFFLKAGLPPLWALRLPNILAGTAAVALVWSVLRFGLRDRLAANFAASFLVTSTLYFGIHVTRTGDFDGLVGVFVLGFVLCVWRAFSLPDRPAWLYAAALCLFAAVMTKGVAGTTTLPGLALFALTRPNRTLNLLRRPSAWLAVATATALCIGYYATREAYDPGYFKAVMENELGGRFLKTIAGVDRGPLFYVNMLFNGFEPGFVMAPLCLFPLLGKAPERRDLAGFALSGGLAVLLVVSAAHTKLLWYVAPAVPLFSIAGGVGLADAIRWIGRRSPRIQPVSIVLAGVMIAGAAAGAIYEGTHLNLDNQSANAPQVMYGPFLTHLDRSGLREPVEIVDIGVFGYEGWLYEDFIVNFYQRLFRDHWRIEQLTWGHVVAPGTLVATCDKGSLAWLRDRYSLSVKAREGDCVLARAEPPPPRTHGA